MQMYGVCERNDVGEVGRKAADKKAGWLAVNLVGCR